MDISTAKEQATASTTATGDSFIQSQIQSQFQKQISHNDIEHEANFKVTVEKSTSLPGKILMHLYSGFRFGRPKPFFRSQVGKRIQNV